MDQFVKLEVAVDSIEGALAAQTAGAERVELCADLLEGGITPSAGMLDVTRRSVTIDINAMIRPRGGDFLYSELEYAVMQRDIAWAKAAGANGVVMGILNPNGSVDMQRMATLIDLARPLSVTFHRAFDMTCDPDQALEALITLGVDRVLTSGQASSALEGLDLITQLVQQGGDRIVVIPGGGITEHNIDKILHQSGVQEIHVSGRATTESAMVYRNLTTFMGGVFHPSEYSRMVTDAGRIRAFLAAARNA